MQSRFIGITVLVCAFLAHTSVLNIPYSGGVKTGTVEVRGSSSDTAFTGSGSLGPDTVIFDGGVRLVVFTEIWNTRRVGYNGPRRHWHFLTNSEGPIGFQSSQDSVWANAQAYPSGPLSLDTIPYNPDPLYPGDYSPSNVSPSNLIGVHAGLQVGNRIYGGLGYPIQFTLSPGHNRVIYFQMNKGGGNVRYGKLMVYDTTLFIGGAPLTDGPRRELSRTIVAYTLSSSTDINSGAVVGVMQPVRPVAPRNRTLIWSEREGILIRDARNPTRLYDLNGKMKMETKPFNQIP
jgi:hypothetical protein